MTTPDKSIVSIVLFGVWAPGLHIPAGPTRYRHSRAHTATAVISHQLPFL